MRTLWLAALLAAAVSPASAQRMMPSAHFPGARPGTNSRQFSYPIPLFYDSMYPDVSVPLYPAYGQPAVVVLQSPPAAESAPDRFAPPAEPLLIELQGDRYVRLSGDKPSDESVVSLEQDRPQSDTLRREPMAQRSPAVLVFRDGHREEVSEYTIADGFLYAPGDYTISGLWSRKIELSSLDLSQTMNSNHARGIPFRLPSAANEVIVGP